MGQLMYRQYTPDRSGSSTMTRPNDEPPTCEFGQHGPRVNACDREAVDGSEFCEVHSDDA
jgi:hypothetical protein